MIIKECRFLRTDDKFDISYRNWSRIYEWCYAFDVLKSDNKQRTVHNTSCGEALVHKTFSDALDTIPNKIIYNSDIAESQVNQKFSNFFTYDILTPSNTRYDYVLNISTVEDLGNYYAVKLAFTNLLAQTKKRLIITCDYPGMKTEWLRDILDLPIGHRFSLENALNGANSAFIDTHHSHLHVLLVDIIL